MQPTPNDILRDLRLAASHVLIEAGAGSGKTTALVDKIRWELGLHPEGRPAHVLAPHQIVAITFTRKAAAELRERLRRQILRDAATADGAERERIAAVAFGLDQMMLGTLDAFAIELVRRWGPTGGLPPDLRVMGEGEARLLVRPLVETWLEERVAAGTDGAALLVRQFGFRGAVEWLVTASLRPDALARAWRTRDKTGGLGWATRLAQLTGGVEAPNETDAVLEPAARALVDLASAIYGVVRETLLRHAGLTLQQLQHEAARLLKDPQMVAACQDRWKLVCVDEHQDTSNLQARFLFQLAGLDTATPTPPSETGLRMVFVGDPKQGIYGFRGADITMWRETAKRVVLARGTYLQLRHNHRSHPQVLAVVDQLLGKILNEGKPASEPLNRFEVSYSPLLPARRLSDAGGRVDVVIGAEKGHAASVERVAARLQQILAEPEQWPVQLPDGRTRPIQPSDIAILVRRLSGRIDTWQGAAATHGFRLQVRTGTSIWSRPEVRDLEAVLTVLADPSDREAWATFLRSPLAGIDDVTLTRVLQAPVLETALVAEPAGAAVAPQVARWRALAGRVPAGDLLRLVLEETGFVAWAAGQPDGEAAVRTLERLVELADGSAQPLASVARQLATKRATADRESDGETPVDPTAVQLLTIHGAKGLEWPLVVVPELDERILHGGRTPSDPTFNADFGLLLPIGAVDPAQDRTLPPSVVFARYEDDQAVAQYAEAKRLFYVALTRARDYLVLETLLKGNYAGGPIAVPRTLAEGPQWRHMDGIERWVRFCWPTLCQQPPLPPADLPQVHVLTAEHLLAPVSAASGTGATRPDATGQLPQLVVPSGDAPAPSALLAPVPRPRLGKRVWSATELKVFREEPWRHWWQYRHSVSTPQLALDPADQRLVLTPSMRGTILHQFFSETVPPAQAAARLDQLLRRHLQVGEAARTPMVASLLRHVEGVARAGLADRLAAATRVAWSVPFTVALDGEDTLLTGEFDLLLEEGEGRWTIIDLKTLEVAEAPTDEAAFAAWIQPRVADHELQLALYTWALADLVGWNAVGGSEILFTSWGHTHAFEATPQWAAQWREIALGVIDRIRRDDYGPLPTFRASLCGGCPVRTMCRPQGDPLLLVGDTTALAALQHGPPGEEVSASDDPTGAAAAIGTSGSVRRRRQQIVV